jgi:hypothetical protein
MPPQPKEAPVGWALKVACAGSSCRPLDVPAIDSAETSARVSPWFRGTRIDGGPSAARPPRTDRAAQSRRRGFLDRRVSRHSGRPFWGGDKHTPELRKAPMRPGFSETLCAFCRAPEPRAQHRIGLIDGRFPRLFPAPGSPSGRRLLVTPIKRPAHARSRGRGFGPPREEGPCRPHQPLARSPLRLLSGRS